MRAGGDTAIKHSGDVGVIHHRKCLPFRIKSCQDLFGVLAGLDQLIGNLTLDGLRLLSHPNSSHSSFADTLDQPVLTSQYRIDSHLIRSVFCRWQEIAIALQVERARRTCELKVWKFQTSEFELPKVDWEVLEPSTAVLQTAAVPSQLPVPDFQTLSVRNVA